MGRKKCEEVTLLKNKTKENKTKQFNRGYSGK
jgi:hypothetical protein